MPLVGSLLDAVSPSSVALSLPLPFLEDAVLMESQSLTPLCLSFAGLFPLRNEDDRDLIPLTSSWSCTGKRTDEEARVVVARLEAEALPREMESRLGR